MDTDLKRANQLKERAIEVRNEDQDSENSAQRVGQLLHDMIDYNKDAVVNINNIDGRVTTLEGTTKDLQTAISQGAGPGNGNNNVEVRLVNFHTNLPHSNVYPEIPTVERLSGNVSYSSRQFTDNTTGITWTRYDDTPTDSTYDTWRITLQFIGIQLNGIIGPIRLRNGGIEGSSNGEDTDEIEFIYCRPEANHGYVDWAELNSSDFENYDGPKIEGDDPVPIANYNWYNHPQGITSDYRYEYYSYRTYRVNNGEGSWSGFCQPMIWSRWGEDGTDGDGVEYIFYAAADGVYREGTIQSNGKGIDEPQYWHELSLEGKNDVASFSDNEYIAIGSLWEDNPIDLSDSNYGPGSKEWVSIRKKQYDETAGKHVWGPYSPPALWSGVGSDSVVQGYVVDLVNENMPVVVDVNGNIVSSSYSNQARVQVQYNGSRLAYKSWETFDSSTDTSYFSYRVATTDGIVYSDSREYGGVGVNGDPIQYQIDGADFNVSINGSLEDFSGVTCNIKLEVKLPGTNNISTLICTLYGVYIEGVENVDMYIGAPCIHADASGKNPQPSGLPIGVKIGKGRSTTTLYYSKVLPNGSYPLDSAEHEGFTFTYYFDDNANSENGHTGGNIPLPQEDSHTAITVKMYYQKDNNSPRLLIDSERIPYVRDGASNTVNGIENVTRFYKAVVKGGDAPDIPDIDPTTPQNIQSLGNLGWYQYNMDTGWGPNRADLYYCDYTEYTSGGSWGNVQFDSSWEVYETINGADGYTLIVTPSYAIFEEELIKNSNGSTSTKINTSSWSAKIQILKGDTPQKIWYSQTTNSDGYIQGTNCKFLIKGNMGASNSTELTIGEGTIRYGQEIPGIVITSSDAITGNIHITLTKEPNFNQFVSVDIPIYINRVGTRIQTIEGDVETTIMGKTTTLVDEHGNPVTFGNLGEYIRTSTLNKSELSEITKDFAKKAELEQTSVSLTSKIENLNIGTKNYFNFTYCQFMSTAIPFIQGYGLEGYGSNMQVRNLDFQTNPVAGSEEIIPIFVTCDMRMQNSSTNVKVSVCDTDPINIVNDNHSVAVVTTWKSYTFVYNIQNIPGKFNIGANQNSPNGTNGHITFSPTSSNNDNRLYVRNLMVSRGNTQSSFNVSWRDYDSQTTRNQALIVADNAWNYHYRLVKQEDKYKGFDIYKFDYPNTLQNYDLISATKVNTKQNKIYTLSFYAKTDYNEQENNTAEKNGNGRNAFMYGNGDAVNGTVSITNGTPAVQSDIKYNIGSPSVANKKDCETNYKLNNGWQQFIIHWYNQIKPDSNGASGYSPYMRNVIAMRAMDSIVQKFSVAGVELREGWWDADGINSSSLIRQTADEITLKVKETGINIDDGTIELNADKTTVKGGLNLYGGDQGLKIYDGNGGEKISVFPDNIPEISGNDYKYTFQAQIWKHFDTDPQTPVNGTLNFIKSIGDVNIGDTIHINRLLVGSKDVQKYGDVGYTLKLTVNNTTVIGRTQNGNYSKGIFQLIDIRQVSTVKGEAIVELTLTGVPSIYEHILELWIDIKASSLSKIGQDGAVFATDINDFHYFGPTKTIMSHQNTQLSVEDTGIYNNGCDIGGKANVKLLDYYDIENGIYNASTKETFIVITANVTRNVNIYLPDPKTCFGKIYYMKRFNSGRIVKVSSQGTGELMISSNSSTSDPEITLDFDSQMFISTGTYWVHFRCN